MGVFLPRLSYLVYSTARDKAEGNGPSRPCADGGDGGVEVDEEEEVREYRVKCLNNLAAAQLKLEQYEEALSTSRDVLTLEQNNVKALFRTGKVRRDFKGLGGGWWGEGTREAHPESCLKRIFSALLLTVDLLIFFLLAPFRQGRIQRGHGGSEKGLETGAYHQGEIVWRVGGTTLTTIIPKRPIVLPNKHRLKVSLWPQT